MDLGLGAVVDPGEGRLEQAWCLWNEASYVTGAAWSVDGGTVPIIV